MSREQIIKDFRELYIGKNPEKLEKEYYQKKKKEMFLLIIAAILIVILCVINDWQKSTLEDNKILRKDMESGKDEISLQVKGEEGEWKDLFLVLYPKEYSESELEVLFTEACEKLPDLIRNENDNLDKVVSDLDLVQEIEGYPFTLSWESPDSEIMDTLGQLVPSQEEVDKRMELIVTFQYENWEKTYHLPVHIITQSEKDFMYSLEEFIKEQEKTTREQKEFYLPDVVQNESVQWRYPPGNTAIVLGILFSVMLPFISSQKDKEIHNQAGKRMEQLQESFPEFISKLILLMEAGMNIRGAVFWIVEDYQKKQIKEKNYLYEELMYICRQMKNGLSEKEAYDLLGKRCNLTCYKKLSGLLIQHLVKGGSSVLSTLREESQKAGEEQKRQIQKKGEEMGTKLLFPMIIMLGIVMVFIMVPALFSFQV